MKRKYFVMFVIPIILLLLVSLFYLSSCGEASTPQALYQSKCSDCHALSIIDESDYSKDQVALVVMDMKARTTAISTDDAIAITTYLENRAEK